MSLYFSKTYTDAGKLFGLFFALPITFLEMYAYTVVGLLFASIIRNETALSLAYKPDRGYRSLGEIFPFEFQRFLVTLLLTVSLIVFSVVLFLNTDARQAEQFTKLINDQLSVDSLGHEFQSQYFIYYFVVIAAISEEIIFRLCLQNWICVLLKDKAYSKWFAIIVATVLWMIAHVGMLEPEWVKMLQVFVIGLVLGLMSFRFGIQYAILLHILFNLAMVPIGQRIIS